MEWSTLELKLFCGNDLEAFNLFQKLFIYAVVSIINGELKKKEQRQICSQRQNTPVDREGGGNPEWNHMMKFDIKALVNNCCNLLLAFDLDAEGVIYGTTNIGKVLVPLKDLIDEFNGALRFLRYQVRTSDGKLNGVLNFCYKLNGTSIKKNAEAASPEANSSPDFHFPNEKVLYPSVEALDEQSPGVCYPSLRLYAVSIARILFTFNKVCVLSNRGLQHQYDSPESPTTITTTTFTAYGGEWAVSLCKVQGHGTRWSQMVMAMDHMVMLMLMFRVVIRYQIATRELQTQVL